MLSFCNLISAYILLTALAPCITGEKIEYNRGEKRDLETFQKLLDEADPPALHEALHALHPQKYKHGAFPEDRTAVEFIHKEEPSVATSIVNLARRQNNEVVDLSKRQDSIIRNDTTTIVPPPSPNSESSTRPTPVPPISESSTPAPASTTVLSTSPTDAAPSTTTIPVSTSNENTVSSAVVSTTSAPPTTSNTGRPSSSLTLGQLVTTTNAAGQTVISTVGGGATTITPSNSGITSTNTKVGAAPTSVVKQTSTLPNGSKSVVTAVTVVGAGESGAGDTPSGTAGVGPTSTSASPGLQTGEAVMTRGWKREMVLIVGGAVAFAGMM